MARERRGRWFDPELVKAFCSLGTGDRIWSDLRSEPLADAIAAAEPIERAIPADESRLDRIAHAFALVVDAKSAFTYHHSDRVAAISEFAYDASCHHERIDGRGYHRGVPGDGLSTSARIMATADIFDALSAARPYRGAMPLDQVLKIIGEGRGTQLCPATVDAVFAVAQKNSAPLIASA